MGKDNRIEKYNKVENNLPNTPEVYNVYNALTKIIKEYHNP